MSISQTKPKHDKEYPIMAKTSKKKKKTSPATPKAVVAAAKETAPVVPPVKETAPVVAETKETAPESPVKETAPVVDVAKETAPVVEEKKETPKPETIKPTPIPAKIAPSTRLKAMLKEYGAKAAAPAFSVTDRSALIASLNQIVQYAISHAESGKTLDVMYDFFVKERRGILSEEVVFAGASKLGATARMKLEVFYGAMMVCVRNKTAKKPTKIDLDRVRKVLKSEKAVGFFAAKVGR